MHRKRGRNIVWLSVFFLLLLLPISVSFADPLPSWNDGAAKSAILDFVARVTKEGGPDYVRPAERIDLAMLRYVKSGAGQRLALLIHHDDAVREVAYDREFRLSPLTEALDKASDYGITIVSMKN